MLTCRHCCLPAQPDGRKLRADPSYQPARRRSPLRPGLPLVGGADDHDAIAARGLIVMVRREQVEALYRGPVGQRDDLVGDRPVLGRRVDISRAPPPVALAEAPVVVRLTQTGSCTRARSTMHPAGVLVRRVEPMLGYDARD